MIIRIEHTADSHTYVLRGIRYRDELILAEIMRDRADDGTGPYTTGFARVHCSEFQNENDRFVNLPLLDPDSLLGSVPQTLNWMLDRDGEAIALCRIGYLFTHAHVFYLAVHPDWRGQGIATTIATMLLRNIGYVGEETVSFESMSGAPAIDAIAARFGITAGEQRIGKTGQQLTRYEFTSTDMAERIKADPEAPEVKIDGKTPAEVEEERKAPGEEEVRP